MVKVGAEASWWMSSYHEALMVAGLLLALQDGQTRQTFSDADALRETASW